MFWAIFLAYFALTLRRIYIMIKLEGQEPYHRPFPPYSHRIERSIVTEWTRLWLFVCKGPHGDYEARFNPTGRTKSTRRARSRPYSMPAVYPSVRTFRELYSLNFYKLRRLCRGIYGNTYAGRHSLLVRRLRR